MSSPDRQPINRFEKNSCASLVLDGPSGRASRKFWCFAPRTLRRRFDHATTHSYFTTSGMNEVGPGFGLHERGMLQQLAVQSNPGIRPGAWSGAMQNVQSIGAIDFRLRLFERDGTA